MTYKDAMRIFTGIMERIVEHFPHQFALEMGIFDKTEPCRLHPCCEAQNVSCCHACIYRKCPSRCEKGTKK